MKTLTIIVTAALLSAAGLVAAADPTYDAAREKRMNEALDTYRDKHDASSGPAERAENSIKSGARKTGHAIERGAKKVGHAVGTGIHKTGDALHNAGAKLQDKTSDK